MLTEESCSWARDFWKRCQQIVSIFVSSSVPKSSVIIVDNSIVANHPVKLAIAHSLFAPLPEPRVAVIAQAPVKSDREPSIIML